MIPVAYVVREMRLSRMLTLAELARRSGISRGHLFHIENRDFAPSLATLERICQGLGVGPDRLWMSVSELLLEDRFIQEILPLLPVLSCEQRKALRRTLEAAPKVSMK